jgi:hypothetical protein
MGQVSIADLKLKRFERRHTHTVDGIGSFTILELPHKDIQVLLEAHSNDEEKLGLALMCASLVFDDGQIDVEESEDIFSHLPVPVFTELSNAVMAVQKVGAEGLATVRESFRSGDDAPGEVSG